MKTATESKRISRSMTDRHRKLEVLAVVFTGVGKFVFMDLLEWRLPFIVSVIIAWTVYVLIQTRRDHNLLLYWGFRVDNFWSTTRMLLPFGALSLISFCVIGYQQNTLNVTWHIIPILVLYPVWGVIQQFLVVALVAGNLQDLKQRTLSKAVIISITALLFGLLHYPYYWLIAGTFILALLYGFVYLRHRNVFVLGLFHGWLGGIFFYTVVGRDPFIEIFGKFLH
jgi:uncharacterized protein